ncbi:unnamed protein product [Kluyveromyces dobzhanskii CBS 2104]|uniref:WGS project CCBQ000000000 data, contig 00014 n=1 Tax=Kluyveromyces dobzhanskii CBS 2104 TaxID=1427455 RepID=A0A0A8L8Y9_9SACH|nr:unnamed protein product [Kluyveromyces dobzhanskii CBS 2104]
MNNMEHTVLFEWNSVDSALNIPILPRDGIKKICIYDFDNTLFKSPAPNPHLYSAELYSSLLSPHVFSNGGWWSEPRYLELLIDEWTKGSVDDSAFWNKDIVDSAKRSWNERQDGTLNILMTGRKEMLFSPIFEKLLKYTVFGDELMFHAAFLKRAGYSTTMKYKTDCLSSVIDYYKEVDDIVIYDDRIQQLEGFDIFFQDYKKESGRQFKHTLSAVTPVITYLPPRLEIATVAEIFKEHNKDVHSKLKGLEMVHGPICSLGFHMDILTLESDHNANRFMLDCNETHKIRELVEQISKDTSREYPFTLPIIVPLGSTLTSAPSQIQASVTPVPSTDDFKKLAADAMKILPNRLTKWSIHETFFLKSSKLAFSVTSPQRPGIHILFTSDYSDADMLNVEELIKSRGIHTDLNHSLPEFKATAIPRYYYVAEAKFDAK